MPTDRDSQRAYLSLSLEGPSEALEVVIGELFQQGCLGLETFDDTARQRAYFPLGTDLRNLRDTLTLRFTDVRVGPVETIAEQDWVALSRKDWPGGALGERFFVCPTWEPTPPDANTRRIVLKIDPEQAFGTGRHDTTRLCLELLERCAGPGVGAIDVGTGTGILAMAAAALGCRPVMAIDADPTAAACARENTRRNRLDASIEILSSDLADVSPSPAGLLVANLHRPLLDRELGRLADWLTPQGFMILSGITVHDVDEMAGLLEALPRPMEIIRHHTAGEWAALVAKTSASRER